MGALLTVLMCVDITQHWMQCSLFLVIPFWLYGRIMNVTSSLCVPVHGVYV